MRGVCACWIHWIHIHIWMKWCGQMHFTLCMSMNAVWDWASVLRERSVKAIKTFFIFRNFFLFSHRTQIQNDEMMMKMMMMLLIIIVQTAFVSFLVKITRFKIMRKPGCFRLWLHRLDMVISAITESADTTEGSEGCATDDINSPCEQVVLSQNVIYMWHSSVLRSTWKDSSGWDVDFPCILFEWVSMVARVVTCSRCQTMSGEHM